MKAAIAWTEVLKLCKLAKKRGQNCVSRFLVCCNSKAGNKLQCCIKKRAWCVIPRCQDDGYCRKIVFSDIPAISPPKFQRYIYVARFLLQSVNILSSSEGIAREENGLWTLSIYHLEDGKLFSSWTEDGPLLVRAANLYVSNPIKHNSFRDPSFKKGERGPLWELQGPYQKRDKNQSSSFRTPLPRPLHKKD